MPTLAHKAYLDSVSEEWEWVRLGVLGDVYAENTPRHLHVRGRTDRVLTVARTDLADELQGCADAHRQRVVSIFENWWDKYSTTMQDIKGQREEATKKPDHYLEVMGYE